MLRGLHCRLGGAWIDDDDLGAMRIVDDALPHNGMRNAQIAPHKHDARRLLEIRIGVGRRVEAESS